SQLLRLREQRAGGISQLRIERNDFEVEQLDTCFRIVGSHSGTDEFPEYFAHIDGADYRFREDFAYALRPCFIIHQREQSGSIQDIFIHAWLLCGVPEAAP